MALVAYDCSDSSDFEDNDDDQNENNVQHTLLTEKNETTKREVETNLSDTDSKEKIKDSLPSPVEIKSNFNVVSWDLLKKNRTQPIRISVPSLEDDKDDETDTKPKIKRSASKCGLFALLPKPKHMLIPSSMSAHKQIKKNELIKNATRIKTLQKTNNNKSSSVCNSEVQKTSEGLSDDFDEDDKQLQSFFFLPEEKSVVNTEEIMINMDEFKEADRVEEISSNKGENDLDNSGPTSTTFPSVQPELSESQSEVELDKEALEKLCGRRGKRLAGEIEMVNVSGAELVGDSKLWLAKQLTQQTVHFKRSKFDPLQRRKHQITFLAAQAREQELELSNQWANNRMTRKQTQAKYGF